MIDLSFQTYHTMIILHGAHNGPAMLKLGIRYTSLYRVKDARQFAHFSCAFLYVELIHN